MSGERFGHSNGDSGWRWDKGGVGMGGKEACPATEIKEGLGKGKEYEVRIEHRICILYFVFGILHYVFSILPSVLCFQYSAFCIMYSVFCILYYVFSILHSALCIQYSAFCIMYSVFCLLYFVFCILYYFCLTFLL